METRSKSLRGVCGPDAGGRDPEGEPQIEAAHNTPSPPHLLPVEVRELPVSPRMEVGVSDAEQSQGHTNVTRPGHFTLEFSQ